jgi:hypothetical protein
MYRFQNAKKLEASKRNCLHSFHRVVIFNSGDGIWNAGPLVFSHCSSASGQIFLYFFWHSFPYSTLSKYTIKFDCKINRELLFSKEWTSYWSSDLEDAGTC